MKRLLGNLSMWEGAQVCCGAGRPRWSVERASFFCARRLRNDLERGTRARERTQADELGRTQSKERAWYTRPFLRASTTNPGGRSPRRGRGTHVLFFAPVDLEMIRREARAHASAHRQTNPGGRSEFLLRWRRESSNEERKIMVSAPVWPAMVLLAAQIGHPTRRGAE